MINFNTYFHKKILSLPIAGPIKPGGIYILNIEKVSNFDKEKKLIDVGVNLFNTKISLKTFVGESIELTILHPSLKLTDGSIDIEGVEREGMAWAEEKGLYPGGLRKTLLNTFVSGLVASCYPMFNEVQVKLIDKWIRALFAIDDWVDDGKLSLVLIQNAIKTKMEILTKIATDSPLSVRKGSESDEDTKLTEAMKELFVQIRAEILKNGGDVLEFLESLNKYFKSVLTEKKCEQDGAKLDEKTSVGIREDSSGAVHAIKGGSSILGINIKQLEDKYYVLSRMLSCSAFCFVASSNFCSDTKERNSLKESGEYTNLVQMKDAVAFNLIQIKWQSGEATEQSFSSVFQECVNVHNKSMETYYVLKAQLKAEMIQNEKSGDEDPVMIKILHEKVELHLQIMEGWLSQSLWALLVPRYNLDVEVCQSSDLIALEARIKALI
ncbi:MAG: hypothetical protein EXS67_05630 [Candidatus Margulisbacteria bacterium]|nr:hypothetical protein [Candidatus Margulisiibacteriota bacterium]